MPDFLLGLIGDNILDSRAPELHRLAGELSGKDIRYDLRIPDALGMAFPAVFEACRADGRHGVNVTLPYKERVVSEVEIADPLVQAMGAVNTVVFTDAGPCGFNTDYSGFISAYKAARGGQPTGPVCMFGAGGVGKAVAFGLIALGATDIRLVETDLAKAEALAAALMAARPEVVVQVSGEAAAMVAGADGLINCTPMGMVGYGGTPIDAVHMPGAGWAFDAVYTPRDTAFLGDASAAGLQIISGYELFFYQGVDAFHLFTGLRVDEAALRRALADSAVSGNPDDDGD